MRDRNSQQDHLHIADDIVGTIPFIKDVLLGLLEDAFKTLPSYQLADYTKDRMTLVKRLTNEGTMFATVKLPSLIQGMLDHLEGRKPSYPGFRIMPGVNYPHFLRGIFAAVIGASDEANRAIALKMLYAFSVAFKKLEGPYKKVQLAKQWREFVDVDRSLRELTLQSGETAEIMAIAERLCYRDFKDFDIWQENTLPRPGPGATATKTSKGMRYEPHTLYTRHHRVMDYQEWFYLTPWYTVDVARKYLGLIKNAKYEPCARFLFVPKTYGKARGICAEENETQVLQQAVSRSVRQKIAGSYLSKHLALTDQTVNANAALAGSLTRMTCTIDESEASDRIPRDVVSLLWQRTPLSPVLNALSTRWILPPVEADCEDPIFTEKYAPMGSGLCFPIMSLVHFYLIKAIMLHKRHRTDSHDVLLVYGDDIVVPFDSYDDVVTLLPLFGMKLNLTKSYKESFFRESCGIHAYHGVDITPVYVRRIPRTKKLHTCSSLINTEFMYYEKGFDHTARVLRQWLRSTFRITDVVGHQTPYLGFRRRMCWTLDKDVLNRTLREKPTRYRKKEAVFDRLYSGDDVRQYHYSTMAVARSQSAFVQRFNPDYQCLEYKMLSLRSPTEEICIEDPSHACLRWHWMHTEDSEHFGEPTECILQSGWVLESAAKGLVDSTAKVARWIKTGVWR